MRLEPDRGRRAFPCAAVDAEPENQAAEYRDQEEEPGLALVTFRCGFEAKLPAQRPTQRSQILAKRLAPAFHGMLRQLFHSLHEASLDLGNPAVQRLGR